jgi:hypothetical protein
LINGKVLASYDTRDTPTAKQDAKEFARYVGEAFRMAGIDCAVEPFPV